MADFKTEVDTIDKAGWHTLIEQFDDAIIYQTWSVGAARMGEHNLSHLLLRDDGDVVAAAQVVLKQVPLIKAGIAHVRFGPMWQRKGHSRNVDYLHRAIAALRDEYSHRRGLLLRIKPWVAENQGEIRSILESSGSVYQADAAHYKTFIIDLSHSLEQLHSGLKPKWRYNLKRAGRHTLTVSEITGDEAMRVFNQLYDEMHSRKGYYDTGEIRFFRDFYADLPEPLKPSILVCHHEDTIVAAIAISLIGDRALYLFGATGNKGASLGASYVLHWKGVEWLRERGCRWYDLEGVSSRGVRQFKSGLTGKSGAEVHMGDFDVCDSLPSRWIVNGGVMLKDAYRGTRRLLSSLQAGRRTRSPSAHRRG